MFRAMSITQPKHTQLAQMGMHSLHMELILKELIKRLRVDNGNFRYLEKVLRKQVINFGFLDIYLTD